MNSHKVRKEIGLVLERNRRMFLSGGAPSIVIQPSHLGTLCEFTLSQARLRDDIGYIDIKIDYRVEGDSYTLIKYCFKFFSLYDTVTVSDKKSGSNKTKRYGFRVDRDSDNSGWGHPQSHLQLEFLDRPRFNLSYVEEEREEFLALSEFIRTITESFCDENTGLVESYSLLHLS